MSHHLFLLHSAIYLSPMNAAGSFLLYIVRWVPTSFSRVLTSSSHCSLAFIPYCRRLLPSTLSLTRRNTRRPHHSISRNMALFTQSNRIFFESNVMWKLQAWSLYQEPDISSIMKLWLQARMYISSGFMKIELSTEHSRKIKWSHLE